ncbi:hypothetical protein EXIGLDRAFT_776525 [Exidia glandulosa HHB12029]|uniref:Uncharacterized protein n=1 Tax=Exidia glandulosa HHB12029 TaxID=1314781 RepID=A0A165DFY5_EXIGL|nr:hypothetical protein EXIGLDRAFT_776525 [Exidia glandulosa HHB12029]
MDLPIPSPGELDLALHRQLLLNFRALNADARAHALSRRAATDCPIDWEHIEAMAATREALETLLAAVFQEVSDAFQTLRRLHDDAVMMHEDEMSAPPAEVAARRREILREMTAKWKADQANKMLQQQQEKSGSGAQTQREDLGSK